MNHLTIRNKMKESVDKCMLVISNEAVNLNSVMPDETYKEREMELVRAILQELKQKGYRL